MAAELASSIAVDGWEPLTRCLEQLRGGHAEVDQFLRGLLEELDQTHSQLSQHELQLLRQREQLADQRDQLAQREQSAQQGDAGDERTQAELESLREERDELRKQLKQERAQGAKLTDAALELTTVQAELARAQGELAEERKVRREVDGNLGEDVQGLVSGLEQERAVLETELEAIRRRAAELSGTLDEQKRRAEQDREKWAAELAHLRRILQQQAEWLAEQHRAQAVPAQTPAAPPVHAEQPRASAPAAAEESGEDTVLESVMAQFEMIQKDIVRRREKNRHG